MKNIMHRWRRFSMLAIAMLVTSTASAGHNHHSSSAVVQGEAVTGWNQRLGMPVATLRFIGELMFDVAGVCGPDGSVPIGIDTPLDALMCSYAAPLVYQAFFGVEVTEDTPNLNIPFADYPQLVTHASDEGSLPAVADAPWYAKSNGAQVQDYTVQDWLRAKGRIEFTCGRNKNSYRVRARNLVPGGLYTVWGFFFDQLSPPPPDGTGGLQPDFAFGGTSANVFVADKRGRIDSEKFLGFCPQSWPADEQFQLVNLFLVFHADGRVNATVGHTVATPPFVGPGVTATPQLMFPIPEDL